MLEGNDCDSLTCFSRHVESCKNDEKMSSVTCESDFRRHELVKIEEDDFIPTGNVIAIQIFVCTNGFFCGVCFIDHLCEVLDCVSAQKMLQRVP